MARYRTQIERAEGTATNQATKVLLVEDDADVRKSTVLMLKSIGCEVMEVDNAALRQHAPAGYSSPIETDVR